MRIFLIRHGESEGNVIHQINDIPQRIVNQSHPDSMAARCLRNLARKTGALPRQKALAGERNLIWSHIFQQGAY